MDQLEAILFPSDGRSPSMVPLATSPTTIPTHHGAQTQTPSRMPHPEVHMDYIAENLGSRAWKYLLVEALDGMHRKFAFNKAIREIQGRNFNEGRAWRGNIVVAKWRGGGNPFTTMTDASMADFPIIKNYLATHGSPGQ